MDEVTRAFFRKQMEESENQTCIDCGSAAPQWASVSHGCYISLESSGVHRSLGVHISFVRSVTMDSWKPLQLKIMELGGNRRLKAFFQQHNIPDNMSIAQKYNTRAAEWYRRNLRALAEGSDPPPPLPAGTGHLPVSDTPTTTQIAFAKAAQSGMMSAGGAFASDARHYGGYHDAGADPVRGVAVSGGSESSVPRRMDGFGSGGAVSQSRADSDDLFGSFLNSENKVAGIFGMVGSLASKAKSFAAEKIEQAQTEGLVDALVDTVKTSVGAAVETTTWAATKGVEVTKNTYTYVNEGGGKAVLGRTSEVLGNVARSTTSVVGESVDWFGDQLGSGGSGGNASGLASLSSGKMQGFGSDSASPPRASSSSNLSYHEESGAALPRKPSAGNGMSLNSSSMSLNSNGSSLKSSGGSNSEIASSSPVKRTSAPAAASSKDGSKKDDLWNDDDWGEWK